MKRTSKIKAGSEIETETTAPGAGRGSRVGKIARLPWRVRENLNRRLLDGEPARRLVAWLNRLPEVRAVLRRDFDGRPVSDQNLSEWKHGGFRDYVAKVEADALLAETLEVTAAAKPKKSGRGRKSGKKEVQREEKPESVTDRVADWFFPYYVAAARGRLAAAQTEDERWNVLRTVLADLGNLRRNEHQVERLRLWREKMEVEVTVKQGVKEEEFLKWARKQKGLAQKIWPKRRRLTPKQRRERISQIFGIYPLKEVKGNAGEEAHEAVKLVPFCGDEMDREAKREAGSETVVKSENAPEAKAAEAEPVRENVPASPAAVVPAARPVDGPPSDPDEEPDWVRPKRTSQAWRTP